MKLWLILFVSIYLGFGGKMIGQDSSKVLSTKPSTTSGMEFCMDLSGDYQHELVKLTFQGKPILSEKLTTEPTVGLAKQVLLKTNVDSNTLFVEIPRLSIKKEFTVKLSGGRYLDLIFYNQKVGLTQSKTPFLRD